MTTSAPAWIAATAAPVPAQPPPTITIFGAISLIPPLLLK